MQNSEKYLKLLAQKYPDIDAVRTEIINLESIMNLPKGTEHFVSDIHGEYDAFEHVLRNGSGNIKQKINEIFSDSLTVSERDRLATLVYYPEEKIPLILEDFETQEERESWYRKTLLYLIELTLYCAKKYTNKKVSKAIPAGYTYIVSELLFRIDPYHDKDAYYEAILETVIALEQAEELITVFSHLIQQLVVDHLHVVGDIYDRGPHPEKIMERLKEHHSFDIQWGNHDTLWMGAASGSAVCIANVIRICARYDNLEIIEDAYGIPLRQLLTFAQENYSDDIGETFIPKKGPYSEMHYDQEATQLAKIQQAIAVIQFKLEKQVIDRNPEFEMENRLLLGRINYDDMTIELDGETYQLNHYDFPTVAPEDPFKLTREEESVVKRLVESFTQSEVLRDHIAFMINNGSMYLVYNGNLLYHGCVPITEKGEFLELEVNGKVYSGRTLFEAFDEAIRQSFFNKEGEDHQYYLDLVWYLWTGEASPLFGKDQMTTFERYYIDDKAVQEEIKNPYYAGRENEEVIEMILEEFGADKEEGRIINGHTPVKERKGENPLKANNRMIVIDGGFSKSYHAETGIAGYTLLYNSYGMQLATHDPFTSRKDAVLNETDIISTRRVVEEEAKRQKLRDTDTGEKLKAERDDLIELLEAYEKGIVH